MKYLYENHSNIHLDSIICWEYEGQYISLDLQLDQV